MTKESFVERDLAKIAERLWPGEPLVIVAATTPTGQVKASTLKPQRPAKVAIGKH